jgi:hypothetical protein
MHYTQSMSLCPPTLTLPPTLRSGGPLPLPLRGRGAFLALFFAALLITSLPGCGAATLDFAGYPDKARDRLYSEGRLGGDQGVAHVDLRKAWQAAFDRTQ